MRITITTLDDEDIYPTGVCTMAAESIINAKQLGSVNCISSNRRLGLKALARKTEAGWSVLVQRMEPRS